MSGKTSQLKNCISISVILLLTATTNTTARTICVDDDGPADFNNIQAAINDSNDGDVIVVADGTYYENINFKGKNITLKSTDPTNPDIIDATIVDAQQKGSVVTFYGTEDSSCILSGFTLTGGYTNGHGGGVCGNGMRAGISNCNITRNSAYRRGGGLFDCDGSITYCTITKNVVTSPATTEGAGLHSCDGLISNCTISDNSSGSFLESGFGGGLYKCHGQIVNCTISGNVAGGNGGGLYDCDGPVIGCTIISNKAEHYRFQSGGGGLYRCDGNISRCIIRDNRAEESGGGFYDCRGQITNCLITANKVRNFRGGGLSLLGGSISNCVITFNSANEDGGGLYGYSINISNCIISGNSTNKNGGGLCVNGYGSISNCTVTGNKSSNGGGIYCKGGNSTVANCILWNNKAAEANEIYLDFYIICGEFGTCFKVPSLVTVMYSDVQGGTVGVHIESDCTLTWAMSNIDKDPCFAEPGYWDPNGTPENINDDFWVDGDYHLKSQAGRWEPSENPKSEFRNPKSAEGSWVKDEVTSPCIDAGDPASPVGLEPFPNGGIINMGAYGGTAEASKSYFGEPVCETIVAGDINGDCRVDFKDFALLAYHWLEKHH